MAALDPLTQFAVFRGDHVVLNRWLAAAVGVCVLLLLGCGYAILSQQAALVALSQQPPLIVRIDQVGRPEAIVDRGSTSLEPADVQYFLRNVFRLHYSRNRTTLARDWSESLNFFTRDAIEIMTRGGKVNPITALAKSTETDEVEIEVLKVVWTDRDPPYQAQVDFYERTYVAQTRTVTATVLKTAIVDFVQQYDPELGPYNPLGLFIITPPAVDAAITTDDTRALAAR